MNMPTAIQLLIDRQNLDSKQMDSCMRLIMTGQATHAQIGGFLVGLRMKGETVEEITAAAKVMRELSTKVQVSKEHLVDTCGTGGDSSGTFNISTATAFVVAALNDEKLAELYHLAYDLGMDVLIEVHDENELARALALKPALIGINNRNLRTFETRLNTTIDLLKQIPKEHIVVTESGIHKKADVQLMQQHNVNSFLVGEAFMRADIPGDELRALFF